MVNNEQKFLLIISLIILGVGIFSFVILFGGLKITIVAALVLACVIFAYKFPRLALWSFIIYLPFAGTVTYAFGDVFRAVGSNRVTYDTSSYALFHLAKDVFYFPALLAIIISTSTLRKFTTQYQVLLGTILLLFATSLLTLFLINGGQQLNLQGNEQPFLMGIIGLKVFVGYIPFLLVGYYLVRQQKDLLFFTRLQVILIIVCCSLSFLQYFFLQQGICPGSADLAEPINRKASLLARCFVGGSLLYNPGGSLIRLPGTFVAPWQWGWFLISSIFVSYATFVSDSVRRWRFIGAVAIICTLLAAIMSGQRIAMILVPMFTIILTLCTMSKQQKLWLKLGGLMITAVLAALSLGILEERWQSLLSRWRASPPLEFMGGQFIWVTRGYFSWLGHGLGRASSAARRLGSIQLIETFHPKLIYEVGMLNLIIFLVVVTVLTVISFKVYQSLHNLQLKLWAICLWIFVLFISYNPYYYPLAVDPVAVYYWLFAGILLKLPDLDTN